MNYAQNYNGQAANFTYDLERGTYSCQWNGSTNFVVGLGWDQGAARWVSLKEKRLDTFTQILSHNSNVTFNGTYQTQDSGSFYAVYGWVNDPLAEYYVVESYGASNPCTYGTQLGYLDSDDDTYQVCNQTRVQQASINGTQTFLQYFSVRQNQRTAGTVDVGRHMAYWNAHGMGDDYNYQVFVTEAWSGAGNSSNVVS